MHLVRIRRQVWDVLAVADDRGRCLLDDLLEVACPDKEPGRKRDKEQRTAKRMIALLRADLPANGPRGELSKHLDDHILELRRGPKHGKQLRITYFYGAGRRVIVCARWFFKREKTPSGEIRWAKKIRERYLKDELDHRNVIESFD